VIFKVKPASYVTKSDTTPTNLKSNGAKFNRRVTL